MTDDRARILQKLWSAANRKPGKQVDPDRVRQAAAARLASRPTGPIPARGQLPDRERIALFVDQAEAAAATTERIASLADVPAAVAAYLRAENMPLRIRRSTDRAIADLPWDTEPLLDVEAGAAEITDTASVTGCLAAVAETGTLLLHSGRDHPVTLNFLPDTHIIVLDSDKITGTYEEMIAGLRADFGDGALPRAVNMITGPSRTADIEQQIELGAHGPRHLHIILIDPDRDR